VDAVDVQRLIDEHAIEYKKQNDMTAILVLDFVGVEHSPFVVPVQRGDGMHVMHVVVDQKAQTLTPHILQEGAFRSQPTILLPWPRATSSEPTGLFDLIINNVLYVLRESSTVGELLSAVAREYGKDAAEFTLHRVTGATETVQQSRSNSLYVTLTRRHEKYVVISGTETPVIME
jgi:hypothetical protein